MQFGHFDDAKKEYVITSPKTPLPWINYLGSENFFSLISNTCGGYSFYKDAKLKNITFKGNKAVKAGKNAFKGIKANAKVTVPYKISKKNLNKIKKAVKSAGKKVVIKRKDIVIPY